jgi:AcrR family transcriptional regulator
VPRVGLTHDRVVEEAGVLADEVGLGNLTLVALAQRLGVRQPSLYKHIASMADLHRSLGLQAKNEIGQVLARSAAGRHRGDALLAMSHDYRAWAQAHPARYEAAQQPAPEDDTEQWAASWRAMDIIGAVLAAYGLAEDDLIDAIRAYRSALHGFITLEALGSFQLGADVDRSFDRLISGLDTTFRSQGALATDDVADR